VTGARDLFKKTDVVVYPNPAKGPITVGFDLEQASNVSIDVLDELGKVVMSKPAADLNKGTNKINLDMTGFRSGIYYCRLSGGVNKTVQFVVVR
jgi:hypothetical protein